MEFQAPDLLADLATRPEAVEAAPFGIIGFDAEGIVRTYNSYEARSAGLSPATVVGHHLFRYVAPCMNNFMVAQRFEDETDLDETIDYVLTLRMRPTRVKLRLLKAGDGGLRYVLVRWA